MPLTDQKNAYLAREFPMSDDDFSFIQSIAYDFTGIRLSEHKKDMIYGRLARRLRALGLQTFKQYCDLLGMESHAEHNEFINAITTNLTSFFREPHHFEFLRKTALPEVAKRNKSTRKIRVWSAGCSTGEEPYSLGIILEESTNHSWDVKLLATDLDSNVLSHAREGVYRKERIETVSDLRRKKWFYQQKNSEFVKVKEVIGKRITFNRLNLLEPWPMKGKFDIIFCRNVVIYFDKPTQKKLFDNYANYLADDGYLFIGHSESLHNVSTRFKSLGKTIYQKIST